MPPSHQKRISKEEAAWRCRNPEWMQHGTPSQQRAFRSLQEINLFDLLAAYDPVHIGTIAMDLDLSSSDIDIACYAPDLDRFDEDIQRNFSHLPDFTVVRTEIRGQTVSVSQFMHELPFEIYAEQRPVEVQNGYRHYMIARRLLGIGGTELQNKIRELKRTGFKTEPAFAHVLRLQGDPYAALLELESDSDDELQRRLELIRPIP